MLIHESHKSHILIASDIEGSYETLKERFLPNRVVGFIEDGEFKLENAKLAIEEAYISEAKTKYIVLGAKSFNAISQNALLKVLEEPPKNIEFIIIAQTKSNLLETVRSRLPVIQADSNQTLREVDLNLLRIDYASVFSFLKEHSRIGKNDAKELLEGIYYRATVIDKLLLSKRQLENFDMAYRLLEVNAKPQNVLSMILMSFISEK